MTPEIIEELKRSQPEETHVEGPGARLRSAREAKNLTVAEVASQLRLRLQVIESIEKNDYGSRSQHTFVCGYLRAYANLLGLPANEIVAAYIQLDLPEAPPMNLLPKNEIRILRARNHRLMRWVTFLVIGVLVVLTAVWSYNQAESPSNKLEPGPVVLKQPQQMLAQAPKAAAVPLPTPAPSATPAVAPAAAPQATLPPPASSPKPATAAPAAPAAAATTPAEKVAPAVAAKKSAEEERDEENRDGGIPRPFGAD